MIALPPWYDEPFPFDSIFSLALSNSDSALKAIALEGHRDFREFDMRPALSVGTRIRDLRASLISLATGISEQRKGYFRYASRPNEIFFVVSDTQLIRVCSGFLERWRNGEFGHYQ